MKSFIAILLLLFANYSQPLSAGWKVTGGPERLVGGSDERSYMQPIWSPDGSRIAFTGPKYQGIWIIELTNGQIKQVSDEPAAGFGFAWSSRGEAIVSRVAKYEGLRRLNAVKVFDIRNEQTLTLKGYQSGLRGLPNWTDNDRKIYLFDGRKLKIFDSGINAPALQKTSTDKPLYYSKSGQIAIRLSESEKTATFEPLQGKRYINLAASSDGDRLAFEVVGGNMYVMRIDGTDLVDLGPGNRPQWSPDSQYIVYQITKDDGHEFTASDIYTIKIDGTEKSGLTNTNNKLEMNPSWSPDGNKIAFDTFAEGAIYIVHIEK